MACACAGYGGAVLAILAASVATYDPLAARWAEEHMPFYGVNLGGWLLTERYVSKSVGRSVLTLPVGQY